MNNNIITNEWMDATICKPFRMRRVIVRFDDGDEALGMWNGAYWTNKNGSGRIDRVRSVVMFYMYERYYPDNA